MKESMTDLILRTQEEINKEYSECAMQHGDKSFKLKILSAEIDALEKKMFDCYREKAATPSPAPDSVL